MDVILRDDVKSLGKAGDLVRVKPGYARNFLLPQGLAYEATEGNKKRIVAETRARTVRLAAEIDAAVASAAGLSAIALTFSRSITNTDITVIVQAADSLDGSWTDIAHSLNGAPMIALAGGASVFESGTGAIRNVEVRDPYLIGDPAHPRRFMRVKIQH